MLGRAAHIDTGTMKQNSPSPNNVAAPLRSNRSLGMPAFPASRGKNRFIKWLCRCCDLIIFGSGQWRDKSRESIPGSVLIHEIRGPFSIKDQDHDHDDLLLNGARGGT